jgi:hydrogenase/urease accessory protein HupE
MKRLVSLLMFVLCTLVASTAFAHKPSDSYLTLTIEKAHITGRWDIALRDLSFVMDLDADGDGKITWAELTAKQPDIDAYALGRLGVGPADQASERCKLHILPKRSVAAHSDGTYTVLELEGDCDAAPSVLAITYRLFFDVDQQHRGLLHLESGTSRTHVFTAKEPTATFDLKGSGTRRQFQTILVEGIFHIWTGYDHILFLIALLLPAVLRDTLKKALLDILRIVTAFTIAHSITLSLAALGIVTLPSRLIESGIAASVVLAALNNLKPILREDRWVAAFLLGLMHGFGFSAALMDLDLPRSNLVLTLFGFNLGVEIGQIAIVGVFVPLAFAVRKTSVYQRWVLRGGSVIILVLASIWLIERAFDVKIL